MNIWDIVILAAVAIAVFFAVRRLWKKRKNGCSCGCGGCDCGCGSAGDGGRGK